MKKSVFMSILMLNLFTTSVLGANIDKESIKESEVDIFFDDNKLQFDLPILNINNSIYVPLREVAEKFGITLNWNDDEHRIMLRNNSANVDIYAIFERLFGFRLSDKAEILHYDYTFTDGDDCFVGKISITQEDVDVIKKLTSNMYEIKECQFNGLSRYYWWDLEKFEPVLSYETMKHRKTPLKSMIMVDFFVTQQDGDYYLYAVYL